MPALLDDPTAPTIYRTSGEPPYPTPFEPLPSTITPRRATLRDRITTATLIPFHNVSSVPLSLLSYLCSQMNREIEKGDTYPMTTSMTLDFFGSYWFANFAAVMLLGDWGADAEEVMARLGDTENVEKDWEKECLGSFYIKPNYPGRSSHVCNGGFLVTDGARNRGVGRLMGEGYLEWAPKLGYTYSVFNLVYETNVASCRIWDALGFKRIGRVKGCGNLKSYSYPVDAIIYGRELNSTDPEDFISEERFEKIKYYLKHQKYPDGADRAEKSRLRSAATHYRLVTEEGVDGEEPTDKLYLKDKEVISDPQKQYEIARKIHLLHHGGINKTTATIAEKYHWVRIKETATLVIKNCPECFDSVRNSGAALGNTPAEASPGFANTAASAAPIDITNAASDIPSQAPLNYKSNSNLSPLDYKSNSGLDMSQAVPMTLNTDHQQHALIPNSQNSSVLPGPLGQPMYQVPVDPRIMANMEAYSQYMPTTDAIMSGQIMEGQGSGVAEDLLDGELMDGAFGARR